MIKEEAHSGRVQPLIFGKRQYRAPFKIDFAVWSSRAELVLIASKKGDVILKRNAWKKCWKISVQDQVDPLSNAEAEAPRTIECLKWGPLNSIVTVGMSDGHIYHIHADSGNIFWRKLISDPSGTSTKITNLRWCYHQVVDDEDQLSVGRLRESEEMPWIAELKSVEATVRSKMNYSYLFAMRDDMKISILAGGVLTCGVIDLTTALGPYDMAPFVLYDVQYDSKRSSLNIALTTYGPKPKSDGQKPEKGDGESGLQTHIINAALEVQQDIWKCVNRYVGMYTRWINVEEDLKKILKEWQTQKQIFINRLVPSAKNLNLGACLVSYCLSGQGTNLGEAYLERTLSTNLGGLIEFLYNTYDHLILAMNGEFSDAVRAACFHLELLAESTEPALLKEWSSHNDSDVFGQIHAVDRSLHAMSLSFQKTVTIAVRACVANISDLLQFVKWLSILPTVDKAQKKKTAVFPQLAKMDLNDVLKYLIETFIEEDEMAANLKENIFDIDGILAKERRLEQEGFYARKRKVQTRPDEDALKTPEKQKETTAEDGTPQREKTTNFKRLLQRDGADWQEKMDQVSELWSKVADIPEDLLEKLGLNREENQNLPNIKKQCENLRKLLFSLDDAFLLFFDKPEMRWMCEIGSGAAHQGFTALQLKPIDRAGKLSEDIDRDERVGVAYNGLMAMVHDKKSASCFVMGLEGDDASDVSNNPFVLLPASTPIICTGWALQSAESAAPEDGDALTINTGSGPIGEIVDIVYFCCQSREAAFGLVTIRTTEGVEQRRFIRVDPSTPDSLSIHDVPFRPDQFESLALTSSHSYACFVSDDATRVNTFCTVPESGTGILSVRSL